MRHSMALALRAQAAGIRCTPPFVEYTPTTLAPSGTWTVGVSFHKLWVPLEYCQCIERCWRILAARAMLAHLAHFVGLPCACSHNVTRPTLPHPCVGLAGSHSPIPRPSPLHEMQPFHRRHAPSPQGESVCISPLQTLPMHRACQHGNCPAAVPAQGWPSWQHPPRPAQPSRELCDPTCILAGPSHAPGAKN